jgi:hypothetical protein
MTRAAMVSVLAALAAAPVAAQTPGVGRIAAIGEGYTFGDGLGLDGIVEITVPVGVTVPFGRYVDVALSSGYAYVRLLSADGSGLSDQQISGALDTQARLSFHAVPGRLVVFVTGAVPTGVKTVQQEELAILGVLASDIVGFSAATLGSGGNLGGGFAGAIPIGTGWAIGVGATFRESLSFEPVVGSTVELKPGAEVRLRTGIEGPLAPRTYLRMAGIFALRGKDELNSATQNGVGNRFSGYASLDQGLGNSSLTLYVFDVFRSDPRLEATATGTAVLPRSNLIAGGARFSVPLSGSTALVPRVEFRKSWAAIDANDTALRSSGTSFRFGGDLRQDFGSIATFVLQLEGVTGSIAPVPGGASLSLRGFRGGLHLEVRP